LSTLRFGEGWLGVEMLATSTTLLKSVNL
jgi:hypothetical protein